MANTKLNMIISIIFIVNIIYIKIYMLLRDILNNSLVTHPIVKSIQQRGNKRFRIRETIVNNFKKHLFLYGISPVSFVCGYCTCLIKCYIMHCSKLHRSSTAILAHTVCLSPIFDKFTCLFANVER